MAAAIPWVVAAATVASTAVTVFTSNKGSQVAAQGQQAAGNAQKAAYDANAYQQQIQGVQQRNIDIAQAQQLARESQLHAGAIRAAYGAAGMDVNVGSPLEALADTASRDELNRQLVLWQGVADQQGSDTGADISRLQGKAAQAAGNASALGTLYQGQSRTASQIPGLIKDAVNLYNTPLPSF